MRSAFAFPALLCVLACSGGDSTGPSDTGSPGGTTSELAYADVVNENTTAATIYVTSDATRGRLFADVPNGLDLPTDWSPDGHSLLFTHYEASRYSLWLAADDGSTPRRISPDTEKVYGGGLWIPGTSRIAYVRGAGSNLEWRTIRTDGTDEQSLMGLLTTDVATIAWSRDGRSIAFNKSSQPGLWTANADGSGARQITTGAYDYSPRWSPDGVRIAFATEPLDGSGIRKIGVVDASGSNRRVITGGPTDQRPFWSPDGKLVAFERLTPVSGGQQCSLLRVDAAGGTAVEALPSRTTRTCPNAAWRSITTMR